MFFFNLVSLNWTECSAVAACPSLMCFFNKDPIEGTNLKNFYLVFVYTCFVLCIAWFVDLTEERVYIQEF